MDHVLTAAAGEQLSTILDEEKLQQEERMRTEMRRQVAGGPDEAPPKPSRPGYPSPRCSDGLFPSPHHVGQHDLYQACPYAGPHGTSFAARGLHPQDAWNQHHPQDAPAWSPSPEDRGPSHKWGPGQGLHPLQTEEEQMMEDQRWLRREERLWVASAARRPRGSAASAP